MEKSASSVSSPSDNEDIFASSQNPASILEAFWDEADQNWNFVFGRTNGAFQKAFWGGANLHQGRDLREVCSQDTARGLSILRKVRETGEPAEGEVFVAEVSRWFSIRVLRARSGNLLLIHNEITEKELLRKHVHQEQARYQRLFEMGAVKLVVSATSSRILDANAHALGFYGWTRDQLCSRRLDDFTNLSLEHIAHTLDRNQMPEAVFFTEQSRRDGSKVPVEIQVSRLLFCDEWVLLLIVADRLASSQLRLESAVEPAASPLPPLGEERTASILEAFRRRQIQEFPFVDELLRPLPKVGRLKHFRRGQNFIAAGEYSTCSGLSSEGVFRTYLIDPRGTEVTLGFSRPGEFLVSYSALVSGSPSLIFIEALNDCAVLVLDAKEFYHQMLADPRWYVVLYRIQQREIFRREQREIDLLSQPLRIQYARFIDENRDILGLLHNYQIASYLGVTPETLSRIRRSKQPKTPIS